MPDPAPAAPDAVPPTELILPAPLDAAVDAVLDEWEARGNVRRLWDRDATLWTGGDEARWLGWLDLVDAQTAEPGHLEEAARLARPCGHVVVLGMGGSSLCPDVLSRTFGRLPGRPELLVLDSTDPAQVRAVEARLDLASTLFVVSSKSGGTLEPNLFLAYFLDRARWALGAEHAGRRFVAVTDPGSKVERIAQDEDFARVFHGVPSVGGRFSALSDFGMVPAAMMGIDTAELLRRAGRMAAACGRDVPARSNPGAVLGAALGALAREGRDKVTIVASPRIASLGAWLEQLLAESTGKDGKALIPVDGERCAAADHYGADRAFVHLRFAPEPLAVQERALARLQANGHPVVRIAVRDAMDLGAEFLRWELATAVAGAVLGVNPFDQPDVEASKVEARRLTDEVERGGAPPAERPLATDGPVALFAGPAHARRLGDAVTTEGLDLTAAAFLRAHLLDGVGDGDYVALLAYVEMCAPHEAVLQDVRAMVRDRTRAATCLGFGPRFLHSTGQAYKGGPNTGVFLQVTCDDAADLPVPGRRATFGVVKGAQAAGDFAVLCARGRRALRAHVGPDVAAGLAHLRGLVARALAG